MQVIITIIEVIINTNLLDLAVPKRDPQQERETNLRNHCSVPEQYELPGGEPKEEDYFPF